MKAVVLTAYGDVSKLDFRDVTDPKAGAHQVKIRMAGASINPIDWKLRSGALAAMMPLELPAILGRDASGVVTEVGRGVTRFAVGARVLGLVMGAYAELVVADEDAWAVVPAGMNLVEAAALPLVLLTGAQLIEGTLTAREGDRILVTGATGSVGRAAVFAAKERGVRVWAGVGRAHAAEAETLGASGVVALEDDAAIAALPELDGIADTIGGAPTARLFDKVRRGGIVASVVGEQGGARDHGLVARGMWTQASAARLAALTQAVADGRLVIPIAMKLPLANAAEAQTRAEGHAGGKVILTG